MSSLPAWVAGSLRPSLTITWYRDGTTTPEDLTGATLTGLINAVPGGDTVAIAGALTLTDAANGEFRWDFAAADVATAGYYRVQFNATFGSGQTPAKTFVTSWTIKPSLVAS